MKGGVGKTTVSVGLAYELSKSFGKNVLLIDTDPQANATLLILQEEEFGKLDLARKTLADIFEKKRRGLMGEKDQLSLLDIIIENPWKITTGKMDLVPSSIRLFESKLLLTQMTFSEDFIKNKLATIATNHYDFCIIDSPPDFDKLVVSCLTASDYYIVPIRPDYMSQQGLVVLNNKLEDIKSHVNCESIGYIISLIPPTRSLYHKNVITELKNVYGSEAFLAEIKERQNYSIWPSTHKPLSNKEDRSPFVEIAAKIIERC